MSQHYVILQVFQEVGSIHGRNEKEEQDRKDFELILEAYKFKGYDKGRRGIHMRLLHMGIVMNHKKISRLMKKYGLFCPIRITSGGYPYF